MARLRRGGALPTVRVAARPPRRGRRGEAAPRDLTPGAPSYRPPLVAGRASSSSSWVTAAAGARGCRLDRLGDDLGVSATGSAPSRGRTPPGCAWPTTIRVMRPRDRSRSRESAKTRDSAATGRAAESADFMRSRGCRCSPSVAGARDEVSTTCTISSCGAVCARWPARHCHGSVRRWWWLRNRDRIASVRPAVRTPAPAARPRRGRDLALVLRGRAVAGRFLHGPPRAFRRGRNDSPERDARLRPRRPPRRTRVVGDTRSRRPRVRRRATRRPRRRCAVAPRARPRTARCSRAGRRLGRRRAVSWPITRRYRPRGLGTPTRRSTARCSMTRASAPRGSCSDVEKMARRRSGARSRAGGGTRAAMPARASPAALPARARRARPAPAAERQRLGVARARTP